jgi:hypothetical protein
MRKATFCVGLAVWLSCGMVICKLARAEQDRVVVDGAERAGERVRTSGHHVPLLQALEQVTPRNYSVVLPNAGPWADVPVDWKAGGSFVQVLGDLLASNPALRAHVDTSLHLVTVSVAPHASLAGLDAMSAAGMRQPQLAPPASLASSESLVAPPDGAQPPLLRTNVSSAPAIPVVAAAAPTAAAVSAASSAAVTAGVAVVTSTLVNAEPQADASQVWEMRESDGSVRSALQRWAKDAGWQFIWDVPTDFRVDANATIHGSLEQALGAVVDALGSAQVPIQAVLYKGNRVLRIIPKGGS